MGFLYVGAAIIYFRVPPGEQRERRSTSIGVDLAEGGRYVRRRPEVVAIFGLELVRVILYMPYMTLLPVFAADVHNNGAVGLDLLRGASSLCGMLGSLIIASLGDIRRKGIVLLGSGMLTGAGLMLLGQAPSFTMALVALVLVTIMSNAYMVTRSTLTQSVSSPRMRGHEGFSRLIFGLLPLGDLPAGALADAVGAPLTVTLQGVAVLAVFLLIGLTRPRLRRLE
jgi:MFS family permease